MSAPQQYLPPVYRHPLGLPAGSVRALLALMIVAQFCLFLLLPGDTTPTVPLYLHALLVLVMLYFVTRGKGPEAGGVRGPGPLYLPRFFIRGFLLAALAGTVAWRWYHDQGPQTLIDRLTPTQSQWAEWPYLLATLAGCFLLGRLLRLGPWRKAAWFQDFLGWVSLLAMIALFVQLLLMLFVPNLTTGIDQTVWDCVLIGIAATYFAARS